MLMKRNTPVTLIALALAVLTTQCAPTPAGPRIVSLEDLQGVIAAPGNGVKVINFWATWCAPCVKEMPQFEKIAKERDDVNVTLVSLDLDMDPDAEKVRRFVSQKEIQSTVLILDAGDPNVWINKVDPGWSGALPATLIINEANGKRLLVERELHEGDLEQLISQVQEQ
jgi:thiol-disulfide isomerase/thioredoxin